jgi:hypothetical protein
MRPTEKELERYYEVALENYQTLIDIFQNASRDLNAILLATDAPEEKSLSVIEQLLETALFVAFPQAMIWIKAGKLTEERKKIVENAENLIGTIKAIGETYIKTDELITAKNNVKLTNPTLSMMKAVNEMEERLISQKALAFQHRNIVRSLRQVPSKLVDNWFSSTNWTNPPHQIGLHAKRVAYAFRYVLVRRAVSNHVTLHLKVFKYARKLKDLTREAYEEVAEFNTNDVVLSIEPKNISKASMAKIFEMFTEDFGTTRAGGDMPGTPAAKNIRAITDYAQMARWWMPTVHLEDVDANWLDILVMTGKKKVAETGYVKGEKLKEIYITLDRERRGANISRPPVKAKPNRPATVAPPAKKPVDVSVPAILNRPDLVSKGNQ